MSEVLKCPECGCVTFSWIIQEVQFGEVQRTEDGEFMEIGQKMGEVVGSDVEENGVFCTTCCERRDREDLVPIEA